ncbi:MAG: insulinase family protein [Chitinispirillaceae bacterium]|nr:insulinase family protein [Chitinispirillaceae bacterium]
MTESKTPAQDIQPDTILHGFHVDRIQPINELRTTAYVFTHQKTGARLLHLYNDDPENLFCIAFRTPVYDNTGVPHIMEHSVLGGSRRFPVKDPFQEMLKGSLQTFLNALTYRDKTVYPVASQVEKDFFNLVDVYCDAVFHPLITEYTLYQEGWHFEVEDTNGPVSIKGIVYNEMKGVFSDFSSHVARKTMACLMPDTTYAFESGGEPEHIPGLTYERFVSFHRQYYHPSNSYIVLYGAIPSATSLRFLNDRYLCEYDAITPDSVIRPQPLWSAPRAAALEAPAPEKDDGAATVLLSWIVGPSSDPLLTLTGTVLSHYLLGTESSPLKRALVDSGLGEDLDDLCGFGIEAVQCTFHAGLRKSRPEHALKIETLILDTLRQQMDKGPDRELLEGAVRQVEFHLREISGGHFPHHVRLADRCYNSWLYDGDPLAHLAFEGPLNELKKRMGAGDRFFKELVGTFLVDNQHRLRSVIVASSKKGKELELQSERQAARLSAAFTAEDRKRHAEITSALKKRQAATAAPENLATLPRLTRADLPEKGITVPCVTGSAGGAPVYCHPIFTSGIVYLDLGFDLARVPPALIPFVPLYLEILRRCGAAGFSYEQMATRTALFTGGIGTSAVCKTTTDSAETLLFRSFVHGKCLRPRFPELLDLLRDRLLHPDLSHEKQIRDILLEMRNGLNAAVIGNGHQMAMLLAGARLSSSRHIEELMGGVSQLRFLESQVRRDAAGDIALHLNRLHWIVLNGGACAVSITADDPESLVNDMASFVNDLPLLPVAAPALLPPLPPPGPPAAIEINAAVNFVARAWRLDPFHPRKHAHLFLLARHLSTGYLWDKVRVMGGAYGGMAVTTFGHPLFTCASYRDPNLAATLDHFQKGFAGPLDREALDTSIIGAIGRIDQPQSPHGRGFGETLDRLCGYTPEKRSEMRAALLGATPQQLATAAQSVLSAPTSAIAILGSAAAFDDAEKTGVRFLREPLLPA